ncbi:elongation factor G [Bacteroides gallinaceum]|uniref:Elongation factor G n=4 Tax=Pseudomonadati TaxID=3379134 RepID=A0ABT7X6P1_9BACE|nr:MULTISPECIES: elongation factor G [Bacteroidaceae]MBO8459117.1 elongation factor G [Candidatus Gallipaludibacter merdavium]MBD8039409.1 elongation factor G [Phocaeicola intestinalis]MBM6657778.1 elongation factor G [Bacteroides gallinaceum]MBM6945458.1 elongation factor G [Bacteroides gallinaceum]MDN0049761.1 elongation factor G [Bacteroides gallinaceum]
MKVYQTNEIKNIALLGNDGSGKTTLTEALLYESGVIKRRGRITAKNTVSDYFPVEQEYGYSVFSTVYHVEWNGKKLNIIDCPGSDDFVGAAITALNVTDTAVLLLNGQCGPEVGTQNHFRYTEKLGKPVIFLVNQLDSEKCDFDRVLEQLKENYGSKVVPVQYPISTGPDFNSLIDVLLMKKYSWKPEGGEPTIEEIPAEEMEKAQAWHKILVEAAAEHDETLMEKFFESDSLTEDEMREGIRKGLIARGMFPVFCVCAGKDMGVRRLMEFLGNVVPFVDEMPVVHNTRGVPVPPDANGATSLYFFKTAVEPHIGDVQYFKVMSGVVHEGDDLTNADRGSKERMAQLYVCAGSIREKVEELRAGDIGCTVKLKDVKTGNTLNGKDCDNRFNFIKYPNPKYTRAIKPVNEADMEKMMSILNRMREEDPTWVIEQSKELRQILVHGQGEFHLRTLKWRLENNEKLPVQFIEAKIPYRETITKAARADYRHKKQSGGAGQFGEVHLIVEPYYEGMPAPDVYRFNGQEFKVTVKGTETIDLEWGGKLVFINSVVGGAIDARFMPAILKGIMSRMEQGPLTGSYARDVRVIVYDGKMHPVDSNEISFMLAGRHAFSEAFKNAGPKILEPIYDVEVFCPSDKLGDVMSDMQGRRGMIMGMSSEKGYEKLAAKVPLKEMSNYSTALSSLTGGRASFIMKFASYELVPTDVQTKLMKEFEEQEKDEM